MRFVDDQLSAVAAGKRCQLCQRRTIAIHAENTLDGDEFLAAIAVAIATPQLALEKIEIEMGKDRFACPGQPDAIDDAGMVRPVGKNNIRRAGDAPEKPSVRGIPGIEIQSRLGARKPGELGLEVFPNLRVP